MKNRIRRTSRVGNNSVLLPLLMTLSLFVGLCGRPQLGHAQLGQSTPLPTPTPNPLAPPLVAPQHTLPPTVAPPRPPADMSTAALPNLAMARNVEPPKNVPVVPDLWSHAMMRCMDDCGGGEPPGGGGGDPDFSTARIRPTNETGQPGVDLGSRNFNWSLPLVSLPGRSGLGLDVALYYNSLVWSKEGSAIRFNSDRSFPGPGPGFTLGLPKIQQRYVNQDFGILSFLLVTPNGGHVELRQVADTNVYESADSSYTQLIDNGASKLLRTTDGMQFLFTSAPTDAEFNCIQITDRNGNYIAATYNANGDISTITDTLGRVIAFNYDSANYLLSISQNWTVNGQPQTYLWAQFNYSTVFIQTNFPGLSVLGPNNQAIPVVSAVTLPDGSRFTFDYTSWGQVYQISQYAADGHQRARSSYNLPMDSSTSQSECPRFTEERQWAEYWTETVTTYAVDPNNAWTSVTLPDGTIYKEYFATSGWQTGLAIRTESYSTDDPNNPKSWTTIDWTQDDPNSFFQENPRIIETSSFDAQGNRKRVGISYGQYASYGLPYEVLEYAADGVTPVRSVYTDYDMNPAYIDRRIIGLVSAAHVVHHGVGFVSKTTYHYDWDNATNTYLIDQGAATNHDNANYGAGFIVGRGNLCAVRRWNVNAINDDNQAMWLSFTGYNTNGSVIFQADGIGYETRFAYTDAFSDGIGRSTFAYPTSVTDPGGFARTAQINYYFGGITFTRDPKGARTQIDYDGIGRRTQVTNLENGGYSRWTYPPSQNQVNSFTTIQEGAGEAYSLTIFDGHGRTKATAAALPGSVGGYSAQYLYYDVSGHLEYQSNPTEIDPAWNPSGDDAVTGWQWTRQLYDYNDRPTLTINPDGTTREAIYSSCGCAGSDVTTVRDEAGRRRRLTKDSFGRLTRVEELNWDGSVYSTSNYAFNARNQVVTITQQNDRTRSLVYDGHGRLQSRTTPEQGTTTFAYYGNDRLQTVTDARGASTTYTYNSRGLVTNLNHGVPGGVEPTPNVAFDYDAAGNRLWMTDGFGRVDYVYNTMSRLTSETRTFNGLGTFTLSYAYNLAGRLTSITNPWGYTNSYSFDQIGRLATLSSNYGGATYISSVQYRAFGSKQINYGNGRALTLNYDNRLRTTRWDVAGVMGSDYEYREATFRTTFARSRTDATLDRWYYFDHVGRLHIARSGSEARAANGEGWNGQYDGPYSMGFHYDVWGNITQRDGWGGWNASYTATFNNKNQMTTNPGWGTAMQYDAAGNMTNDGAQSFTYDATGAQVQAPSYGKWQGHDGNGLRVKDVQGGNTTYYLRSSALGGQVVAEISSGGTWMRGYVYSGQQLVAIQSGGNYFVHQDPITKSQRITNSAGTVVEAIELDPFGGETNRNWGSQYQKQRYSTWERDWTGDESLFRRYHGWWSRFAHPDPYDGSYDASNPQSFNRYSYVQNDPVNFVDPDGLYAACIHEAMTRHLSLITGHSKKVSRQLGAFAGDKPGGADSKEFSVDPRDNFANWRNWVLFDTGPGAEIHFASPEVMGARLGRLRSDMRSGNYQYAAHTLHAVQDRQPHGGFGKPVGHALNEVAAWVGLTDSVDWIVGDDKFVQAAQDTFEALGGRGTLSASQIRNLIKAIVRGCGKKAPIRMVGRAIGGRLGRHHPEGPTIFGGYPSWWYSMWEFVDWVNSIETCREWNNEGCVGPRPTTPPRLRPQRR